MKRRLKNIDWEKIAAFILIGFMISMIIVFRDKLAAPSLDDEELKQFIEVNK